MTILFKEDWNSVPSAIIDTNTFNKTFLRYSALLREMGVANHTFPLQLHNPELVGVDPYDPNLELEQQIMIAIECKSNIFYYMREIIRDPKGTRFDPIRFKANRGNMALIWMYMQHINTILTVPRQTMKTFTLTSLFTYLLNVACTDSALGLLTKDNKLRTQTLMGIKDMIEELPFYLNQLTSKDIANTEEIFISSLGNKFISMLPSQSAKAALNTAKGLTLSSSFYDEAAYLYNVGIAVPSMLAATTAAREMAKRKGEPYGNIFTTTANSKTERDSKYIYSMASSSALWSEKFYDAENIEDLENIIRRNSRKGELRVFITLNHQQLGYTNLWLKRTLENAESKGIDAERDYFNQWSDGIDTSPLPKDLIDKIKASTQKEYFTEISKPYGYITRWFVPENQIQSLMYSNKYIMALDTSDAVGGDDIGMSIREVKSGGIIAAGNYNETNLITFAEWICQWLIKYDNITLIMERRSSASSLFDLLLLKLPAKNIDPFARMYNKVVQEYQEYPERYKDIQKPMYARDQDIYVRYKKFFGFATSGSGTTSRTELFSSTLLSAAKMTGDKVHDPVTVDQILGLEIRNGRIDHGSSSELHDDLVIAWLLSYWLLSLGKNLQFYGINPKDVLADNIVVKEANTPTAVYDRREQDYIRNQVEQLVKELVNERDNYVASILEGKLRNLSLKLTEEDRQVLAVDGLIKDIREQRSKQRNKGMFGSYYR